MMYCTKCGKQNEDSARFCAFCGAPLKQGGNTENTEQADGQGNVRGTKEKKNRSKAGKILLILLPVLVVLAAAAVTVIVFIIPGQREEEVSGTNCRREQISGRTGLREGGGQLPVCH